MSSSLFYWGFWPQVWSGSEEQFETEHVAGESPPQTPALDKTALWHPYSWPYAVQACASADGPSGASLKQTLHCSLYVPPLPPLPPLSSSEQPVNVKRLMAKIRMVSARYFISNLRWMMKGFFSDKIVAVEIYSERFGAVFSVISI